MRHLFSTVDRLLRGEYTSPGQLREDRIGVELRLLIGAGIVLGAIYGVFMGLYASLRPENPSLAQLLATTVKVPLLFLATLVVTFPSLYVFSALAGSRLQFVGTVRLLLAGIVVDLALLASFGPITGFFTLSTESYPFMIVLSVIFFGVGGLAGLVFMYRALVAVLGGEEVQWESVPDDSSSGESAASSTPKSPTPPPSRAKGVFITWALIYGVVGAQMGWILRPFVGSPDLPFTLFRERQSNFFEAFVASLRQLFS